MGEEPNTDNDGEHALRPEHGVKQVSPGPAIPDPGKTLVKSLAKVMAKLDKIPKKGHNDQHKYDYVREEDVLDTARGLLADQEVVVLPSVTEHSMVPAGESKKGNTMWKADIVMTLTWTDGESSFTNRWAGTSFDYSDKAYWKAYSNTLKYALLKTLLMSAGDADAEKDSPQAKASGQASKQAPSESDEYEKTGGANGPTSSGDDARWEFHPDNGLLTRHKEQLKEMGWNNKDGELHWWGYFTPAEAAQHKEDLEEIGTVTKGGGS